MTNLITSTNNSIVQHVKSLNEKKHRDKLGQFFVEGYRIVKDAFDSNADIQFVVVVDICNNSDIDSLIDTLEKNDVTVYRTTEKVFKFIADTETPQGILAVVNKKDISEFESLSSNYSFLVLLENIQDPGNMGTIIRTADAVGASGVIISKGSVDVYNPKVIRTTMGSIFHIPVIKTEDFSLFVNNLINKNFLVYAAHLEGEKSHFDVDMTQRIAIVIGNEANGISDEISEKCDLIKIPMPGKSESLNASIAAGVLMYECLRQRITKK